MGANWAVYGEREGRQGGGGEGRGVWEGGVSGARDRTPPAPDPVTKRSTAARTPCVGSSSGCCVRPSPSGEVVCVLAPVVFRTAVDLRLVLFSMTHKDLTLW
eukprot:scaffold9052_cov107-Isochrysis_galbana.AAC.3